MKTEVSNVKNNAVAISGAFDDYAGDGYGTTTKSDFIIPRISVLNALSVELKKNDAKYIEGSEAGDLVDTGFGKILSKAGKSFTFLPVMRHKEVIEWKPRTAGGGIVSRKPLEVEMDDYATKIGAKLNEKYEYKLPNGNEVIETWQFYGLILDSYGDVQPAFLPMKKSNLKVARKWFSTMKKTKLPSGKDAPMFYSTWQIGSFEDSGNGNEWWNFTVNKGSLLMEIEDAESVF
ncbi:MAG: hypothetical protein ACRCXK_10405, partial [Wohlfahrtiimonas sp.]